MLHPATGQRPQNDLEVLVDALNVDGEALPSRSLVSRHGPEELRRFLSSDISRVDAQKTTMESVHWIEEVKAYLTNGTSIEVGPVDDEAVVVVVVVAAIIMVNSKVNSAKLLISKIVVVVIVVITVAVVVIGVDIIILYQKALD